MQGGGDVGVLVIAAKIINTLSSTTATYYR